jgi:hypothetical protein
VGDGTTDDSAAFQACADQSGTSSILCEIPNEGGSSYLLKKPMIATRGNVVFAGKGRPKIVNGTGGGPVMNLVPAVVSRNTVPLQSSLVTGPGQAFTLNNAKNYWIALSDLRSFVYDIDNVNNWVYVNNVTATSGVKVTADLSVAGSKTLTFTKCPVGLNGSDNNHSLFINDVSGSPAAFTYNNETVVVTGGTCTSGASGGGTITVTTTKNHTNTNWSIQNASSGLGALTLEFYTKITNGHTNLPIIGTAGRLTQSDPYVTSLTITNWPTNAYRASITLSGTTYTLTSANNVVGTGPSGVDHLALTYDGTNVVLWVNGTSAATTSAPGRYFYIQPFEDFYLGNQTDNFPAGSAHNSMPDGAIDSIRLSKTARYSTSFTPTYTKFLTQPSGPTPQSGYSSDANTLALINFDQQIRNFTGVYTPYGTGIGYLPMHLDSSNWVTQSSEGIRDVSIDGGGSIGSCLFVQGVQQYLIDNVTFTHCFDSATIYDNALFGYSNHVVVSGFANYAAEQQYIGGAQRFGVLHQNTYTSNIINPEILNVGGWPLFSSGGAPLHVTGGFIGGTGVVFNNVVSKSASNDNQQTLDSFVHMETSDEGAPALYGGTAWLHNACNIFSNATNVTSSGSIWDCTYKGVAPIYWDGGVSGNLNDTFKSQSSQPYAIQFSGTVPTGLVQLNQSVRASKPADFSGAAWASTLSKVFVPHDQTGGALPADIASEFVTPQQQGCIADGAHDCSTAFLAAVAANSNGVVRVPPGTYQWANTTTNPTVITGFHGHIKFDQGAVIVPTDTTKPFLAFDASDNMVMDGFKYAYSASSTNRVSQITFEIKNSNNITVRHFSGTGGPSISFQLNNVKQAHLSDIQINGSGPTGGADGVHIANSEDVTFDGGNINNSNDDGVALVNSNGNSSLPLSKGRNIITHVRVRNANANCIRLEGNADLLVTGNYCDTSAQNGIVVSDSASYPGGSARNIKISDNIIKNAGRAHDFNSSWTSPVSGNGYGINLFGTAVGPIDLDNNTVEGSYSYGIGTDSGPAKVIIHGGIERYNLNAAMNLLAQHCEVEGNTAEYNQGIGFAFACGRGDYNQNIASNNSVSPITGAATRAFNFSAGLVSGDGFTVNDTSPFVVPASVTVTTPGSGYSVSSPPTVTISGLTCTVQPVVVATVNPDTSITLYVQNPGQKCTGTPSISIAAPTSGVTAVGTIALTTTLGGIATPTVTAGGSYSVAPSASVTGLTCYTKQPVLSTGLSGSAVTLSVVSPGNDCYGSPSISFSGGTGSGATATTTLTTRTSPIQNGIYESGAKGAISGVKFSILNGSPSANYVDAPTTFAVAPQLTCTGSGTTACGSQKVVDQAGTLASMTASNFVGALNGVTVSGTPTTGQVPTATSSTTATWQTPSGGGGGSGTVGSGTTNQVAVYASSGTTVGGADSLNLAGEITTATKAVTFSATPTFDASQGNTFTLTLTGNVTSSTLSNVTTGQVISFELCQDSTGGRTFAWPSGFSNASVVNPTASACTNQSFRWDGTNAQPKGMAVVTGVSGSGFVLPGSTSGSINLKAAAAAGSGDVVFPAGPATLVAKTDLKHAISFQFGSPGGTALTSGANSTEYVTVPFACTIAGVDILADAGTATFKFWKIATGTAIPTSSNSISTSGISLSTGTALHTATLTDFTTTAISANDILAANISAVSTAAYLNVVLECHE